MTASVSVVVPYRGDGRNWRDKAWQYVAAWWKTTHPTWQVVQGFSLAGPWVKAHAVADGLRWADGDIVVIADADVIGDGFGEVAAKVDTGEAVWAMPHTWVCRLTQLATRRLYDGGQLPEDRLRDREQVMERHVAAPGGGLVIMRRSTYDATPMDPRFRGWGLEDVAWAHALHLMHGRGHRAEGTLWHMYHPAQERISRTVGNKESLALWRRYLTTRSKAGIAALLAEIPPAPVVQVPIRTSPYEVHKEDRYVL